MKYQFLAVLFLILSACSATTETYFAGDTILPDFIDPPYAANSKEWSNDIQKIIKTQKHFGLNELELASREKYLHPEIFILYTDRSLTKENYPNLHKLIHRTSLTCKGVNDHFKNHWNTPRPYAVDKRINMLITPSPGASYPSGHASSSLVTTRLLGMLVPHRSEDLTKLANKIAYRRVLVGMHYPHDIDAGEQLSRLIIGGLLQNKEFRKDFENARIELKKNPLKNQSNAPKTDPAAKATPEIPAPTNPLVATDNQALPAQ